MLGRSFARAIADRDSDQLLGLLHPEVDFRALTPKRAWEAGDPEGVLEIVFGHWFQDASRIDALENIESDSFADRERVGYRLAVSKPEGRFVIEQQAYLATLDGRINWIRVVCSGYRPLETGQ
jgi:hypothetical protein